MKSYLRALTLLAAILTLVLPSAALAETSNFRGETAWASFYSYDPDTCISTSAYLFVTDSRSQNPPGSATESGWASLGFYQWNNCTWQTVVCLEGYSLPEGDALNVTGNLSTATFNGTFDTYDCDSYTQGSASIAVNWQGDGDVFRGNSHSSYHFPGYRVMYRSNGQSRNAVPSGTLTIGGTTIHLENGSGSLNQVNSGTVYNY